jgi:hypothetical protein
VNFAESGATTPAALGPLHGHFYAGGRLSRVVLEDTTATVPPDSPELASTSIMGQACSSNPAVADDESDGLVEPMGAAWIQAADALHCVNVEVVWPPAIHPVCH